VGAVDDLGSRLRVAGNASRARAAYVTWLATPDTFRPPELKTLDKFAAIFAVTIPELYAFMAEPGFMDAVVNDTTHWKAETRSVIQAIKRNAEDAARADQMSWCAAFMALVGHPSTDALEHLIPKPAK
jgi:hypothetical protein